MARGIHLKEQYRRWTSIEFDKVIAGFYMYINVHNELVQWIIFFTCKIVCLNLHFFVPEIKGVEIMSTFI
jgi:hypothetical protein